MTVFEAVKERRSVRKFLDKKIPQKAIESLIESIIWAPSAGNLQSRRFYFVFNREVKSQIAAAALNQRFIAEAPLTIVGCTDNRIRRYYGERGVSLYSIQDTAASIENLMLVAYELGLGSVWIGAFNELEVARILNLPDYLRPVAIVPVGYPNEKPYPPSRIPKSEAVVFIT
ncbi:MAG: nitroreductase family protein [Nitrospirota bacterium]